MMQRSPIITLTRKELKTMLQAAVQEQVEADQKVLGVGGTVEADK